MGFGHTALLSSSPVYAYTVVMAYADAVLHAPTTLDTDVPEWLTMWAEEPPAGHLAAGLVGKLLPFGPAWRQWPRELLLGYLAVTEDQALLTGVALVADRQRPLISAQCVDEWRATRGHLVLSGRAILYP